MNKILVIISGRIGDTIFCTPLLRLIKNIFPDCQLDILVTKPEICLVFKNNQKINHVYYQPSDDEVNSFSDFYDAILVPFNNNEAADYTKRLKKSFIVMPENFAPNLHIAEAQVHFFAGLWHFDLSGFDFNYELNYSKENLAHVKEILKKRGVDLDNDILIGMHLGCKRIALRAKKIWKKRQHKRVWPVQKFAALAQQIAKKYPHARIIITGTKNEKSMAGKFIKMYNKAIILIDETSLQELAALMTLFKLYITGDTAPLHVASASNVNLIALFGQVSPPSRTGPFPAAPNRLYLKARQIQDIDVADVLKEAEKFLD